MYSIIRLNDSYTSDPSDPANLFHGDVDISSEGLPYPSDSEFGCNIHEEVKGANTADERILGNLEGRGARMYSHRGSFKEY